MEIRSRTLRYLLSLAMSLPEGHDREELLKIVGYWREFQPVMSLDSKPTTLLQHIGMMSPEMAGWCTCDKEPPHNERWAAHLRQFHGRHQLFSRAVWETISSVPGLMEKARQALEDDIRSSRRYSEDGNRLGTATFTTMEYAIRLRILLSPTPSPLWIGEEPPPFDEAAFAHI